MLVFPSIFVTCANSVYGYNFVAPLTFGEAASLGAAKWKVTVNGELRFMTSYLGS